MVSSIWALQDIFKIQNFFRTIESGGLQNLDLAKAPQVLIDQVMVLIFARKILETKFSDGRQFKITVKISKLKGQLTLS